MAIGIVGAGFAGGSAGRASGRLPPDSRPTGYRSAAGRGHAGSFFAAYRNIPIKASAAVSSTTKANWR